MTDQFRKNIFLPWDADHNDPEWWDLVPYEVQDAIDNIERRPRIIRWLCRMWCKLFGHRIKTYTGGFEYKAMCGEVGKGKRSVRNATTRRYCSKRAIAVAVASISPTRTSRNIKFMNNSRLIHVIYVKNNIRPNRAT